MDEGSGGPEASALFLRLRSETTVENRNEERSESFSVTRTIPGMDGRRNLVSNQRPNQPRSAPAALYNGLPPSPPLSSSNADEGPTAERGKKEERALSFSQEKTGESPSEVQPPSLSSLVVFPRGEQNPHPVKEEDGEKPSLSEMVSKCLSPASSAALCLSTEDNAALLEDAQSQLRDSPSRRQWQSVQDEDAPGEGDQPREVFAEDLRVDDKDKRPEIETVKEDCRKLPPLEATAAVQKDQQDEEGEGPDTNKTGAKHPNEYQSRGAPRARDAEEEKKKQQVEAAPSSCTFQKDLHRDLEAILPPPSSSSSSSPSTPSSVILDDRTFPPPPPPAPPLLPADLLLCPAVDAERDNSSRGCSTRCSRSLSGDEDDEAFEGELRRVWRSRPELLLRVRVWREKYKRLKRADSSKDKLLQEQLSAFQLQEANLHALLKESAMSLQVEKSRRAELTQELERVTEHFLQWKEEKEKEIAASQTAYVRELHEARQQAKSLMETLESERGRARQVVEDQAEQYRKELRYLQEVLDQSKRESRMTEEQLTRGLEKEKEKREMTEKKMGAMAREKDAAIAELKGEATKRKEEYELRERCLVRDLREQAERHQQDLAKVESLLQKEKDTFKKKTEEWGQMLLKEKEKNVQDIQIVTEQMRKAHEERSEGLLTQLRAQERQLEDQQKLLGQQEQLLLQQQEELQCLQEEKKRLTDKTPGHRDATEQACCPPPPSPKDGNALDVSIRHQHLSDRRKREEEQESENAEADAPRVSRERRARGAEARDDQAGAGEGVEEGSEHLPVGRQSPSEAQPRPPHTPGLSAGQVFQTHCGREGRKKEEEQPRQENEEEEKEDSEELRPAKKTQKVEGEEGANRLTAWTSGKRPLLAPSQEALEKRHEAQGANAALPQDHERLLLGDKDRQYSVLLEEEEAKKGRTASQVPIARAAPRGSPSLASPSPQHRARSQGEQGDSAQLLPVKPKLSPTQQKREGSKNDQSRRQKKEERDRSAAPLRSPSVYGEDELSLRIQLEYEEENKQLHLENKRHLDELRRLKSVEQELSQQIQLLRGQKEELQQISQAAERRTAQLLMRHEKQGELLNATRVSRTKRRR